MKNKKARKIFLTIILVFLLLVFSFTVWQFQNIKAFYDSRVYSKEELMEKVDSSKEKIQEEIKTKYPNIVIKDISADDEAKLLKGDITIEDISNKYNIPIEDTNKNIAVSNKNINTVKNSKSKKIKEESSNVINISDNKNMTKEDKIISNHIGKMYGIKAKYLSMLGSLESQAKAEYQNSGANVSKKDIGYKYASIGGSYESACDSEVESVLSSLEIELSKINADTAIIKSLRASYYDEKQAKKAYYLSLF